MQHLQVQHGGTWHPIGAVDYLLHGMLIPNHGFAKEGWLRLEVVLLCESKDKNNQAHYRAKFPAVNGHVDAVQLAANPDFNNVTRQFESTGSHQLVCMGCTDIQVQFGLDNWARGFWVSLGFVPMAVGGRFGMGAPGSEIPVWQPSLAKAELDGVSSHHGSRIWLNNDPANTEFVHDLLKTEASETPFRVFRHEKQSSRANSMIKWIFDEGHSAIINTGDNGLAVNLDYFSPNNPGEPGTRAEAAPNTPTSVHFSSKHIERLHFMEASGIFKGLSLPAPPVFRKKDADIVTNPNYWAENMNEILEADPDVRPGGEHPHEIITLVLK